MDQDQVRKMFRKIGAEVTMERADDLGVIWTKASGAEEVPAAIDVKVERGKERFSISILPRVEVDVLDARPEWRHLLLLVRHGAHKHKYLCGHDERHWFAAAVPEEAHWVRSVETAFQALRPPEVREVVAHHRLRRKERYGRRNDAYVRQGEWFFVPVPDLDPPPEMILRWEPVRRGNSKPHMLEFAFRRGGETVYRPNRWSNSWKGFTGLLTAEQREALLREYPSARAVQWTPEVLNPELYGRGRVRHPDHGTIVLDTWHRVYPNTESKAKAGAKTP